MIQKTHWKQVFITIYSGQAFSILGSAAVQFAIIWWLTEKTESAFILTLATIFSFLPSTMFGTFAGVWIDRCSRKVVMIAADALIATSSALLGIVFLFWENPSQWIIFAFLFIRGIGSAFHTPAMQAAIPMFVPAEMLTKAGGWGNLISSISTMLGPALGAGMMSVFSISAIMLVDVVGAVIAICCLLPVHLPHLSTDTEKTHFWNDMKQGFSAMKNNKLLMAAFFPVIFASLLYMPLGSLFPLLVRLYYKGGAGHNALVEFAFSVGLLLSSTIIGIWGGAKKRFLMISAAICVLGVVSFVGGILPQSMFLGFVFCSFIMGASGTFFNVPLMAHIQETVEPQVMGKVLSILYTAMTLATPFGLLLAGPISEKIGVEYWFAGSGILMLITGIICFFSTRNKHTKKVK